MIAKKNGSDVVRYEMANGQSSRDTPPRTNKESARTWQLFELVKNNIIDTAISSNLYTSNGDEANFLFLDLNDAYSMAKGYQSTTRSRLNVAGDRSKQVR